MEKGGNYQKIYNAVFNAEMEIRKSLHSCEDLRMEIWTDCEILEKESKKSGLLKIAEELENQSEKLKNAAEHLKDCI